MILLKPLLASSFLPSSQSLIPSLRFSPNTYSLVLVTQKLHMEEGHGRGNSFQALILQASEWKPASHCPRQCFVDATLSSMPPMTPTVFLFLFLGITHHSSTFIYAAWFFLIFLFALVPRQCSHQLHVDVTFALMLLFLELDPCCMTCCYHRVFLQLDAFLPRDPVRNGQFSKRQIHNFVLFHETISGG